MKRNKSVFKFKLVKDDVRKLAKLFDSKDLSGLSIAHNNCYMQLSKSFVGRVRAKFVCTTIVDEPDYLLKVVSFSPIISGSKENE